MIKCSLCEDKKVDILRSDIVPSMCDDPCEDCTPNCKPEECQCPVHLIGACVHYNGCKTFITQLKPGMTFDECMVNIENVFEQVDNLLESYKDRIIELENEVKDLSERLNNKGGCNEWEQ